MLKAAQFRPHRGGLAESMAAVITVKNKQELVSHLNDTLLLSLDVSSLNIKEAAFDARNGWDTKSVSASLKEGAPPVILGYLNDNLKE